MKKESLKKDAEDYVEALLSNRKRSWLSLATRKNKKEQISVKSN